LAVSLDRAENEYAHQLVRTGLSREAATLAVVLVTRAHARPEPELIDIMAQYPGLEDVATVRSALRELRAINWVTETNSYGHVLTHQAPKLRELIATRIGDEQAADRLSQLRSSLEESIRIVGPMNDEFVYSSYIELLRSAQSDIFLPMLATSAQLSSVPIIRERAEAGVSVRALLGSPKVVSELRGGTMTKIAKRRIAEWSRNLAGLPNASVRVSHSVDDMRFASSMAIDGRLVRVDIYDPRRQRSLEGVMMEIESPAGLQLNLASHMLDVLDQAWDRARPLGFWRTSVWWAGRGWKIWAGLLFFGVALLPVGITGWFELFIGVASALLATAIAEASISIRRRRRQRS
jgi:hypothetical protein